MISTKSHNVRWNPTPKNAIYTQTLPARLSAVFICMAFMLPRSADAECSTYPFGDIITAEAGNGQVNVTIPSAAGTISHKVYYSESPNVSQSSKMVRDIRRCDNSPCTPLTVSLPNLQNGTTYYVNATSIIVDPAQNYKEVESCLSNQVSALPVQPTLAYAINLNSSNISAFTLDQNSGRLTAIPGQPFGTVALPASLAVTGQSVYVVSPAGNNLDNLRIDPEGRLIRSPGYPTLNGEGSTWIVINSSGTYAFVADSGAQQVSAYSITIDGNLKHIGDYHSGNNPQSLAITPNGKFLYAANYSDNTISGFGIDANTGTLSPMASTFPSGNNPASIAIHPNGSFFYVANQSPSGSSYNVSAYTINQQTGALTGPSSYGAENFPASVTVDASGNFAYVANFETNNISAFKIGNNGELTGIGSPTPTGVNPTYVTSFGQYLYVSSGNTISALSIDSTSGALTKVDDYAAGATPGQIVIAGKFLPKAPSGNQTTNVSNSIGFTAVDGATSYIAYIYKSQVTNQENLVATVTNILPNMAITELSTLPNGTYYATVAAVNAYGEGPVTTFTISLAVSH